MQLRSQHIAELLCHQAVGGELAATDSHHALQAVLLLVVDGHEAAGSIAAALGTLRHIQRTGTGKYTEDAVVAQMLEYALAYLGAVYEKGPQER